MDKKYTKLGELVGSDFTVEDAGRYSFKRWNNETKKFETSDEWKEGFKKTYTLVTDKGLLDMGQGQLSSLLEAVYYNGKADINGKRFAVKSNGKTGIDIRYFFNMVKSKQETPMTQKDVFDAINEEVPTDIDDKPVNLDDIPF